MMTADVVQTPLDRIDLHCHSTASDGTDAPEALAALAKRAGLRAFALTDHDTLAGLDAAKRAADALDVEFVGGVELSARVRQGEMHLLGYFLEDDHPGVRAALANLRRGRQERIERTVGILARVGAPVTLDAVMRHVAGGSPGRPHVARALVDAGHVATVQEAFDRFLATGRPAYVPRAEMTPAECIGLVRKAGGVSVLAHPFTLPREELPGIVADLATRGLSGLEVEYPRHDAAFRQELATLASAHDLVATGGSDYHGAVKPGIELGTGAGGNVSVPYAALEELRTRR